jgi:hypothetical protein
MITTILFILLAIAGLFVLFLAVLLPIAKFIYTYGESKEDWYSQFDEEVMD